MQINTTPPPNTETDEACAHTGVKCLVALARNRGVDANAERILHDYALGNTEADAIKLVRIAKEIGLKSSLKKLKWKNLSKIQKVLPVILQLKNGRYVILCGVKQNEDGKEQAVIMDPLANKPDFLFLDRDKLEPKWTGQVLFAKKVHSVLDEEQHFGFKWFIPEIIRQKGAFFEVTLAAIALIVIALATPIFFQIVIDKVLTHNSFSTLHVLGIGVVIALSFDALLNFLRSHLLLYATNKIDIRVATRTFKHLVSLPISFFERTSAGVVTKHMQQSSRIREFLTGNLFLTILDSLALFIFIPVLFLYSAELSFIVLGTAGIMALVIGVLIGPFQRRINELYQAEGERQSLLVETIHGIQTVKSLTIEPVRRSSWDNISAETVKTSFKVGKISNIARALTQFLEKMMSVAIIWFGAYKVFEGELTVGALVAFNILSGRVSGPLIQIVSLIHKYQEVNLSVKMLGEVMNSPTEGALGLNRLRPDIKGAIEFDSLSFKYNPNSPEALKNVNLKIPAGAVVGIVGRSGSGKSTLVRLVQGMYPIQTGLLRIDGCDIRELDLQHLRTNIGTVLQENFVFRGTIKENISATKPEASFEEIVQAAKMSGASEFIERLPHSYETYLEENGSNLSGGQKQRLSIARALLTNPRIMILDEATSALDPESEAIVQNNINHIAKGRTLLMVSHRLSMLVNSDLIIVVDSGEIQDVGNHNELLIRCQVYRDLWEQQNRHV